jgi:hypothetical protein
MLDTLVLLSNVQPQLQPQGRRLYSPSLVSQFGMLVLAAVQFLSECSLNSKVVRFAVLRWRPEKHLCGSSGAVSSQGSTAYSGSVFVPFT